MLAEPRGLTALLALLFLNTLATQGHAQRITNAAVEADAPEGPAITLFGFGFGAVAGDVLLFIEGRPTALPLAAPWSDSQLRARLTTPLPPPGTYAVAVRPAQRPTAFLDVTFGEQVRVANFAPSAETGQTQCWTQEATPIACADTGQDGDLRRGVKPPVPRFVDRGDGTVEDALTGIVWLADWECLGRVDWQTGLDLVSQLADGQCGLTGGYQPGDFGLPNVREIETLINYNSVDGLPDGSPINFIPGDAWTSTSYFADPRQAWTFGITTPIPGFLRPKAKDQGNKLPAVYLRQ